MFYHNDIVIVYKQTANHSSSIKTLLDVEVRAWLVKHVDVDFLYTG